MDWYREFDRATFLEQIAQGKVEEEALAFMNVDRDIKDWFREIHLTNIQARDPKFREAVEEAKRKRADTWFGGIAKAVYRPIDKEEVPAEKLKFEMRKYLAAVDNPDKYSTDRKQVDVKIDIFAEIKELKNSEVSKLLKTHDPFVIEAESTVIEESGDIFE
jgi:hypothetical protein